MFEAFSLLGLLFGTLTWITGMIWIYAKCRARFHIGYFVVHIVYSFVVGLSLEVFVKGLTLVILSTIGRAEITATSTIIGNTDPGIINAVITTGALTGITIVIFFTWEFFKWVISKSSVDIH